MESIDGNFVSGSWDRATASMYWIIRQKIEALPDTASKEDVLKVLDECDPSKPYRHPQISPTR
jgi:hypothetical protein